MTYLYGDSTNSGLEINYIELLRDFLDFAVQVMLSEHRILSKDAEADEGLAATEAELKRLRALGEKIDSALQSATTEPIKSILHQSANAIQNFSQSTLRQAAQSLKAKVVNNKNLLQVARKREHAGNTKLIEKLLLRHQLPDSKNFVNLQLSSDGTKYQANVHGYSSQGLQWTFGATIPVEHLFSHPVKLSDLDTDISIELQELTGFVRKSIKLKPHRLSTLYLHSLVEQAKDTELKLRTSTTDADDTGFNFQISSRPAHVSVVRVTKGETEEPYSLSTEDASKLIALVKDLQSQTSPLVAHRSKLLSIQFEKKELSECEDPTHLIKKILERIAPVICKISDHSLESSELVLKRVLANGRREEIFAPKADMLSKIHMVPESLRSIFDSLKLKEIEEDDSMDDSLTKPSIQITPSQPTKSGSVIVLPSLSTIEDDETNVVGGILEDLDVTKIKKVSEILEEKNRSKQPYDSVAEEVTLEAMPKPDHEVKPIIIPKPPKIPLARKEDSQDSIDIDVAFSNLENSPT